MIDIFDNKIFCRNCNQRMEPLKIERKGFILRMVQCPKCGNKIIHPTDKQEYINFINLKKKKFNVKMRFVGNSYAVSIPREIVNFIKEQEKIMDNMVHLCFEGFNKISLTFNESPEKIIKDRFNNE